MQTVQLKKNKVIKRHSHLFLTVQKKTLKIFGRSNNLVLYLHPHNEHDTPTYTVDSVAQLVEHLTFNQRVSGSNPDRITNYFLVLQSISVDSVAQLVEHLTFNQRVSGSNPDRITNYCLFLNTAEKVFF